MNIAIEDPWISHWWQGSKTLLWRCSRSRPSLFGLAAWRWGSRLLRRRQVLVLRRRTSSFSFTFLVELRRITQDLWRLKCLDQFSDTNMARGAMEAHTALSSRTLPAGGFGDTCSGFISSLLFASREIPSRRGTLRRGRSLSMPRGRFSIKGQIG